MDKIDPLKPRTSGDYYFLNFNNSSVIKEIGITPKEKASVKLTSRAGMSIPELKLDSKWLPMEEK